jgi:DNA-binding GntR family transcriptional regulator
MIEPEIVKTLAGNAASLSFTELSNHLATEDKARQAGDRGTLVRLTGEFHLQLVQLTGNAILIRLMAELQALICLAILLYATGDDACPEDEHRNIIEAIVAGNGPLAADIMLHHLKHIETDLKIDDGKPDVRISEALDWLSGKANVG